MACVPDFQAVEAMVPLWENFFVGNASHKVAEFSPEAMAGWRVVARRGEMASSTSTPGLGTGQPLQRILRVLGVF